MQKEPLKDGTIEAYRAGYKDLDRIWSVLSKTCGLSDAEYWSLLMIREGALTQHEISERLFMSKQTVNSAFRQLVKKGLVRLKAQEDNLRVKRVWMELPAEERVLLTRLTRKYNGLLNAELQKHLK